MVRSVVRGLLSVVSLFLSFSLFAQEPAEWKMRTAYRFQSISFSTDAHGAAFLASFDEPKKWGVRGGFHYSDKFGDQAPGYDVGGTYWLREKTVVSLDAEIAPRQIVIPRQAYTVDLSQVIEKIVPSLGYRFADYTSADAHTFMPGLTWYFLPRWDWMIKYFFTINALPFGNSTNHSVMTRLDWNIFTPLNLFAGYSRSNESFESGNAAIPAGGFSADHLFGGLRLESSKGMSFDMNIDREWRSNDTQLTSLEAGVSYRW